MKERGIICNRHEVTGILDGRITQVRRVIKPQPVLSDTTGFNWKGWAYGIGSDKAETARNFARHSCPRGKVGDRLWVKETFRLYDSSTECACYDQCKCAGMHRKPIYRADEHCAEAAWTPSSRMPRWISRITLEITGIRVERVQDITINDLEDEGVSYMLEDPESIAGHGFSRAEYYAIAGVSLKHAPEIYGYADHWDSINGAGSWNANPWVWVTQFKIVSAKL